jgi:hypothetical protein
VGPELKQNDVRPLSLPLLFAGYRCAGMGSSTAYEHQLRRAFVELPQQTDCPPHSTSISHLI